MVLFHTTDLERAKLSGKIEMNESFFEGAKRGGRRGRGVGGKSIVFGLLKRGGRVYTGSEKSISAQTLMTHIESHTCKDSVY